jgi:hypothetical protein
MPIAFKKSYATVSGSEWSRVSEESYPASITACLTSALPYSLTHLLTDWRTHCLFQPHNIRQRVAWEEKRVLSDDLHERADRLNDWRKQCLTQLHHTCSFDNTSHSPAPSHLLSSTFPSWKRDRRPVERATTAPSISPYPITLLLALSVSLTN